jgi:anti-anti-sigma factor
MLSLAVAGPGPDLDLIADQARQRKAHPAAAPVSEAAARKPDRLVIDLSEAGFIDAAGVHAITRTRHALGEHCPLVLLSPAPQVRRVLEICGLDSLCTIETQGEIAG